MSLVIYFKNLQTNQVTKTNIATVTKMFKTVIDFLRLMSDTQQIV